MRRMTVDEVNLAIQQAMRESDMGRRRVETPIAAPMNRRDDDIATLLDQPNPVENVIGCRVREIIQSINTGPFGSRGPVCWDATRLGTEREHP
jgi:hypothetical protein